MIFRKIKSDKGAVDKILVTLLLVVIGVTAVIGLATWEETQKDKMLDSAETTINTVISGS